MAAMRVPRSGLRRAPPDNGRKHLAKLSLQLGALFDASQTAGGGGGGGDVTLRCADGGSVAAHAAILTARNAFFAAALGNSMRESVSREVELPSLDEFGVAAAVRFLYTGVVSVAPHGAASGAAAGATATRTSATAERERATATRAEGQTPGASAAGANERVAAAASALLAAHYLGVQEVADAAGTVLLGTLRTGDFAASGGSVHTALRLLNLACLYGLDDLRDASLSAALSCGPGAVLRELVASPAAHERLASMSPVPMALFVADDRLLLSERDVLRLVQAWAAARRTAAQAPRSPDTYAAGAVQSGRPAPPTVPPRVGHTHSWSAEGGCPNDPVWHALRWCHLDAASAAGAARAAVRCADMSHGTLQRLRRDHAAFGAAFDHSGGSCDIPGSVASTEDGAGGGGRSDSAGVRSACACSPRRLELHAALCLQAADAVALAFPTSPESPLSRLRDAFTVEAWVRRTARGITGGGGGAIVARWNNENRWDGGAHALGAGRVGDAAARAFTPNAGPTGKHAFVLYASGRNGASSGMRVVVGQGCEVAASDYPRPRYGVWTHYAAVFDGRDARVYLDGELQTTHDVAAEATARMAARDAPAEAHDASLSTVSGGGATSERGARAPSADAAPPTAGEPTRARVKVVDTTQPISVGNCGYGDVFEGEVAEVRVWEGAVPETQLLRAVRPRKGGASHAAPGSNPGATAQAPVSELPRSELNPSVLDVDVDRQGGSCRCPRHERNGERGRDAAEPETGAGAGAGAGADTAGTLLAEPTTLYRCACGSDHGHVRLAAHWVFGALPPGARSCPDWSGNGCPAVLRGSAAIRDIGKATHNRRTPVMVTLQPA